MKDIFYHVGSDIKDFPLLMRQCGTLKAVKFADPRGFNQLHMEFTIERNIFYSDQKEEYIFAQSELMRQKITKQNYLVCLFTACELYAKIRYERENYIAAVSKMLEYKATINSYYFLLKKNKYRETFFYPDNIDDVIPPLEANYFTQIIRNDIDSVGINLGSVSARISSNESLSKTHLSFAKIDSPYQGTDKEPLSQQVFIYELPEENQLVKAGNNEYVKMSNWEEYFEFFHIIFLFNKKLEELIACTSHINSYIEKIQLKISSEETALESYLLKEKEDKIAFNQLYSDLRNESMEKVNNYVNQICEKDLLIKKMESELKSAQLEIEKKVAEREKTATYNEEREKNMLSNFEKKANEKDKLHDEEKIRIEKDFTRRITKLQDELTNKDSSCEFQKRMLIQDYEIKIEGHKKNKDTDEAKMKRQILQLEERLKENVEDANNKLESQKRKYEEKIAYHQGESERKLKALQETLDSKDKSFQYILSMVKNSYVERFNESLTILYSHISDQADEIKSLTERVTFIRQEINSEIIAEKILDNTSMSIAPSNWERQLFEEFSRKLAQIAQVEERQEQQQLLLETQRWANDARLFYEMTKTENERNSFELFRVQKSIENTINEEETNRMKHEINLDKAYLGLDKKQLEIKEQILREELNREKQDVKIERVLLGVDEKKQAIENYIQKEELNRDKQDLKTDRATFDLEQTKRAIENYIQKGELDRDAQDLKIDRAAFESDQKKQLIENYIQKEELNRDKQDLKTDRAAFDLEQTKQAIEKSIQKEELSRDKQDLKIDRAAFDLEQTKQAIEKSIQREELNRDKQDVKIERALLDVDRRNMQIDFIALQNELKAESLSMKEFAMQKTIEYQRFELNTKDNLVKMGEMINIQEAKNLQGEKSKLDIAEKLAEIGMQIREQNVHFQTQMNEFEHKKIENEKQLLEMNQEKIEIKNLLAESKLTFQKNQNDLNKMILKLEEGEFKNQASQLFLELNQKYFENDVQLQNMGLIQRENEVTLGNREMDIKQMIVRNESVVNNLRLLQQQNRLHSQLESERQSNYEEMQNLQGRIWSLQNSLERSEIELSGERALRKYLQ